MKNIIIAALSTSFLVIAAPSTSAQKIFLYNSSQVKKTNTTEQVRPNSITQNRQ